MTAETELEYRLIGSVLTTAGNQYYYQFNKQIRFDFLQDSFLEYKEE